MSQFIKISALSLCVGISTSYGMENDKQLTKEEYEKIQQLLSSPLRPQRPIHTNSLKRYAPKEPRWEPRYAPKEKPIEELVAELLLKAISEYDFDYALDRDHQSTKIKTHHNIQQPIQKKVPLHIFPEQRKKYTKKAMLAEEYNQNNNPLFILPNDVLYQIFYHLQLQNNNQIDLLKNSIKRLMILNSTCKYFNKLLTFETISNLCKNYPQKDKDKLLYSLLVSSFGFDTDCVKRLPALILICAGANPNTKTKHMSSWLGRAAEFNDVQFITTLLKYHVDPNIKSEYPTIFYAKNVEIAQLLIDNGVDVHATEHEEGTNVLWHIIQQRQRSSDLLEFYLKHNVDTKKLCSSKNSCLLHGLVKAHDSFLQKANLLLDAMSDDMINLLDKKGRTPLDAVRKRLRNLIPSHVVALKKFEVLLIKRGAETAEQLKQKTIALRQTAQKEQRDCIICLQTQENMIAMPCTNIHSERVCVACYDQLLKTSDKCPLCRKELAK